MRLPLHRTLAPLLVIAHSVAAGGRADSCLRDFGAPNGAFILFMRVYWPRPEALDGTWKQPPLVRAP